MSSWYARGLLFENCNCQVVCPGHVHFSQECTHERCLGYWALRFDEGDFGGVDLAGAKVVLVYDSPPLMIDGGWRQRLIVDSAATPEQREALEAILLGRAGGPWEKLHQFVGEELETRSARIDLEDEERTKRVAVEGLLESSIETLRGRDRDDLVTLHNMYNQIHAAEQVVARGDSRYDDGAVSFTNEGTHGLWSNFDWRVSG